MASTQYHIRNENEMHYVTCTIIGWIDLFSRQVYRDIMIDSFKYCQKHKGLEIYAWVIMTNHVHAILRAKTGFKLSGIIRDMKTFTANGFLKAIKEENESRREWMLSIFTEGNQSKIWQDGNHAIECFSPSFTATKLKYLHYNPVRAQIVSEPEHYLYSSAIDYSGKKGFLEIIHLA